MGNRSQGQIITFYSYKGGTGRSMTLANVACILAEREDLTPGKGVLMMDWDLEAPGLHRYFRNKLNPRKRAADSRGTGNCDAEPGLIDLFYELDARIDDFKRRSESGASKGELQFNEDTARAIFDKVDLDSYIIPTSIKGLSLLKAGRFSPTDANEYPERVNKFNWETLYLKSPHLMRVLAEVLSEKYDYVLIDSRTGVTDISGVCTMLLPEKLVVVFTPNMQSLLGAVDVVRRATDYRKESDDLRSLIVFPLVSRVESNEPDLRYDWRHGNSDKDITGYQTEFENVLAEAYNKDKVNLDSYFNEMQIQHVPRYAYGEEIAVLEERSEDKFSLRRGYKAFANNLIEHGLPWEGLQVEKAIFGADQTMPTAKATGNNKSLIAALAVICLVLAGMMLLAGMYILSSGNSGRGLTGNNAPNNRGLVPTPDGDRSKLPSTFENLYLGIVAGRSLTMALKRDGDTLTGSASTSRTIETLSGNINEDGNFVVESRNDRNNLTGIFSGHIDANGQITGKWTDPGGNKTRPLSMALNRGVTAKINSPDDGFLALRSEASTKTGKSISQIPHNSEVTIINCGDQTEYEPGKKARWCVARYNGQTGWVIDAFLTYENSEPAATASVSPGGSWSGDWTSPSGAYLTINVTLVDDRAGNVEGQIDWTLRSTKRPDKTNKIGMTAVEYVRGKFDPATRSLAMSGYRKDDPNNVLVMVDDYRLALADDDRNLNGAASNGGKWDAKMRLQRNGER